MRWATNRSRCRPCRRKTGGAPRATRRRATRATSATHRHHGGGHHGGGHHGRGRRGGQIRRELEPRRRSRREEPDLPQRDRDLARREADDVRVRAVDSLRERCAEPLYGVSPGLVSPLAARHAGPRFTGRERAKRDFRDHGFGVQKRRFSRRSRRSRSACVLRGYDRRGARSWPAPRPRRPVSRGSRRRR